MVPIEELHVWHFDARQLASLDQRAPSLLDSDEKARAERMVRATDRRRFQRFHAASRIVLSLYSQVEPEHLTFQIETQGKPSLAGYPLEFNLSHSGDYAALAVSNEPVGVDIEDISKIADCEGIARLVLADVERARFGRLPGTLKPGAMLSMWTRKEAVLKATGAGFSVDPRLLTLGWRSRSVAFEGRGFRLAQLIALPPGMQGWVASARRFRVVQMSLTAR